VDRTGSRVRLHPQRVISEGIGARSAPGLGEAGLRTAPTPARVPRRRRRATRKGAASLPRRRTHQGVLHGRERCGECCMRRRPAPVLRRQGRLRTGEPAASGGIAPGQERPHVRYGVSRAPNDTSEARATKAHGRRTTPFAKPGTVQETGRFSGVRGAVVTGTPLAQAEPGDDAHYGQ
jgi:hypothetical protein